MANNNERCDGCRYWEKEQYGYSFASNAATNTNGAGEIGKCRRHPPTVLSTGGGNQEVTRFPSIHANGWCGEFAPPLSDMELKKLREWAEHGA